MHGLKADTGTFVISTKEAEAILWTLAIIGDSPDRVPEHPSDPLFGLLQRHDRGAVITACKAMEKKLFPKKTLSAPKSPVKRDILRACVENSTWLIPYVEHDDSPHSHALLVEARCALQTLAAKLEALDIAINHIPFD